MILHTTVNIPDKMELENLWFKIADKEFVDPQVKLIELEGNLFRALSLPRGKDKEPKPYIETGLSFMAWPRIAGFRNRFVLKPIDTFIKKERWQVNISDIVDWIIWANSYQYIVTLSTFSSGAGVPWNCHAQSIPECLPNGEAITPLRSVKKKLIIDYSKIENMPWFSGVKISTLVNYPAKGILIEGENSEHSLRESAKKTYEIAVNFDNLKNFNLVILPEKQMGSKIYFFPRRSDGNAIYGRERWQIGAVEMGGILPCKNKEIYDNINSLEVKKIYEDTTPDSSEFEKFLSLLNSF